MNLVRDRTRLKNRVHALPGTGTSPEVQRNRPGEAGTECPETIKEELSRVDRLTLEANP